MTFVRGTGARGCDPLRHGISGRRPHVANKPRGIPHVCTTRHGPAQPHAPPARATRRATAARIVGSFRARVKKVISAVRSRLVDEAAAVLAGVVLVVM